MIREDLIFRNIVLHPLRARTISVVHSWMFDGRTVGDNTVLSGMQFLSLIKGFKESNLCVSHLVFLHSVSLCAMTLVDKLWVAETPLIFERSELEWTVNSVIVIDPPRSFGHL